LHLSSKLFVAAAVLLLAFTSPAYSDNLDRCVPGPAEAADSPGPSRPPTGWLTIASLNMAGERRATEILAAWERARAISGADVLLLQEVRHSTDPASNVTATLSRYLGFHSAYAPASLLDNGDTDGLAILSRHPLTHLRVVLLKHFPLRFRTRCRIALAATVEMPGGPVQVVNVHLDTRINSSNRVAQLEPVLEALKPFEGPQLLGGDFNTMRILWIQSMLPLPFLQRQSDAVREALGTAGFQTPFTDAPSTFRVLGLPLKLDWLYLKHLIPLQWGVEPMHFSDHRGIWVQLDESR
jgi:endonuclease/exonuclease/phosphatase family metal-dependent hydrolase